MPQNIDMKKILLGIIVVGAISCHNPEESAVGADSSNAVLNSRPGPTDPTSQPGKAVDTAGSMADTNRAYGATADTTRQK